MLRRMSTLNVGLSGLGATYTSGSGDSLGVMIRMAGTRLRWTLLMPVASCGSGKLWLDDLEPKEPLRYRTLYQHTANHRSSTYRSDQKPWRSPDTTFPQNHFPLLPFCLPIRFSLLFHRVPPLPTSSVGRFLLYMLLFPDRCMGRLWGNRVRCDIRNDTGTY
jgi:hypothetical protein